ncbi:hypothetical protein KJ951_04635 [Patescibacteria group bacterium]|nr:hypothetical protein [Patescibacteria group bacterium]MBU1703664.1 hypothetical protein [Patescibacteria group bacterium]MBU1954334.1 hypothetical protein [Patescibacteria group bacterium]
METGDKYQEGPLSDQLSNPELTDLRLIQLLAISDEAMEKFLKGDRFGTIFALIRAGITLAEYQEFIRINPNNWYDRFALYILSQSVLSTGRSILLRTDAEAVLKREEINRKIMANLEIKDTD